MFNVSLVKKTCQDLLAAIAKNEEIDRETESELNKRIVAILEKCRDPKADLAKEFKLSDLPDSHNKAEQILAGRILTKIKKETGLSIPSKLFSAIFEKTSVRFAPDIKNDPATHNYHKKGFRAEASFKEIAIPPLESFKKRFSLAFGDELRARYKANYLAEKGNPDKPPAAHFKVTIEKMNLYQDLFRETLEESVQALAYEPTESVISQFFDRLETKIEESQEEKANPHLEEGDVRWFEKLLAEIFLDEDFQKKFETYLRYLRGSSNTQQ